MPARPQDAVITVYPRPRGGTGDGDASLASTEGLSPPTRGNPA